MLWHRGRTSCSMSVVTSGYMTNVLYLEAF
jgi:hypothetical protein